MSWLDGMVDAGEVASQEQRLDRTTDKPAPGVFSGAFSDVGPGLIRGGIKGINSAKSLLVQAAGADQAMNLGLSGMVLDDQGADEQIRRINTDTERQATEIGQDTAQAVQLLRPDPNEIGFVGQLLGQAADVLPRAVLGGLIAGPAGVAVAAGGPEGYGVKQVAVSEGIDESTAWKMGLTQGIATSIGAVLPGSKFVGNVFADLGIAVGANVGLGMANRGVMAGVLENNGYHAQAAQYRALDKAAILADGLMALGFWGVGRATFRRPTTDHLDAALAERTFQHADVDTAPGAPINPRSATAHQDALATAIAQLQRGEPVVLPDSIHSAEFLRGTEAPRPDIPTRAEALAAARQDVEPAVRAELEREAAGKLPNVADVRAELADVQRSLDGLDATYRDRAKQFQAEGQSRKKAESSARKAIEQERQDLTDRVTALEGSLSGNRTGELARGELAAMDRGETPARLQSRIDERADQVMQGFERNPLAAGVAEGNKMSMAQIARQEIARLIAEQDALQPRPEPVMLDIGTSKHVEKTAMPASQPETPGAKPASNQPKTETGAAETASNAEKPASDPEVQVADEILAMADDMRLPTGATDADGNPVTVSARELMAQADAEIQAAQQDAKGFFAAAACFLQRGL